MQCIFIALSERLYVMNILSCTHIRGRVKGAHGSYNKVFPNFCVLNCTTLTFPQHSPMEYLSAHIISMQVTPTEKDISDCPLPRDVN